MALADGMTALGVIATARGALYLITMGLVSSARDSILGGALYLYAADGEVPQQFASHVLSDAFADWGK